MGKIVLTYDQLELRPALGNELSSQVKGPLYLQFTNAHKANIPTSEINLRIIQPEFCYLLHFCTTDELCALQEIPVIIVNVLVQTPATSSLSSSKPAAPPLSYNNWLHSDYFAINQTTNRLHCPPLLSRTRRQYHVGTRIQIPEVTTPVKKFIQTIEWIVIAMETIKRIRRTRPQQGAFNTRWKNLILHHSMQLDLTKLSGVRTYSVAIITRSKVSLIQFLIKILPCLLLYYVGQGVKGESER
jgi:hypothetical protein